MSKDYHDFTTRETTKAEREKLNVGDIWINAARCELCGETLRSKNRHDYRVCKCGNLTVEGGSWYCKRSWVHDHSFKELSVLYDDAQEHDQC